MHAHAHAWRQPTHVLHGIMVGQKGSRIFRHRPKARSQITKELIIIDQACSRAQVPNSTVSQTGRREGHRENEETPTLVPPTRVDKHAHVDRPGWSGGCQECGLKRKATCLDRQRPKSRTYFIHAVSSLTSSNSVGRHFARDGAHPDSATCLRG